jgi:GlpG protein
MRLIGSISNSQEAESFSAWLTAEGFENHIEHEGNEFQIWIKEEDRVDAARQGLAAFRENPLDKKYTEAKRRAAEIVREKQLYQRRFEKNVQSGRVAAPSSVGKAPLTITLLMISLVVALFTSFGEDQKSIWFQTLAFCHIPPDELQEIGKNSAPSLESLKFWSIRKGELWRLITPIFIHFGTVHLIFNMIWLIQLGRVIEIRFGSLWLLALAFSAAAIGNFVQCLVPERWDGVAFGVLAGNGLVALGGMSGVVYALFGFVWIRSVIDPLNRFQVHTSTVVIMVGWLFFCMLPQSENVIGFSVANWAHALGLVVGMAAAWLGWIMSKRRLA